MYVPTDNDSNFLSIHLTHMYIQLLPLHNIYLCYIIFDPDASNLSSSKQSEAMGGRRRARRSIIEHTYSTRSRIREKKGFRRTDTINTTA